MGDQQPVFSSSHENKCNMMLSWLGSRWWHGSELGMCQGLRLFSLNYCLNNIHTWRKCVYFVSHEVYTYIFSVLGMSGLCFHSPCRCCKALGHRTMISVPILFLTLASFVILFKDHTDVFYLMSLEQSALQSVVWLTFAVVPHYIQLHCEQFSDVQLLNKSALSWWHMAASFWTSMRNMIVSLGINIRIFLGFRF